VNEFECMRVIDESLQEMPDDATRSRIANWVAAKYLGMVGALANPRKGSPGPPDVRTLDEFGKNGEVAGIAKLSQSGDVLLTVRDFKAKSTNDAAIRLVHVLIWVTRKLTNAASVSSRRVVTPWLQKYRCYDGNTRGAIANDKGIVRDGDELSLDFHAEQLAEQYITEILDSTVEGKWKPSNTKRRASKSHGSTDAESK